MSLRYNTAFLADPLEFAREHLMIINGSPATRFKNRDGYDSVESADRVAYWDILEEDDDVRLGRYCAVVLSRDPQEGYLPGFWLPFAPNTIKKVTLHDKRPYELRLQTGPPRAFFTARVNGCSIFVHGDRQTPTVYHTNAIGVTLDNDENVNNRVRAAVLEGRIRGVELPNRGYGVSMRALHSRHYLRGRALDRRDLGFDPMSAEEAGTVFGTADESGDWSFYVQPYDYVLQDTGSGTRKHFIPSQTGEFWPAGGGRVAFDVPTTEPNTAYEREIGAAGKSLRLHVRIAIQNYSSWNQSSETRNAITRLGGMQQASHAALLRAVHHYLSLDANLMAHNHELGSRLKTSSTFYACLLAEYKKWLGLAR